jgi:hypothetical protein
MKAIGLGVALALSIAMPAPPRGATEVLVRVTAEEIPDGQVSDAAVRVMGELFPERIATVTYLTDGEAVRATVSGRMFGLTSGRVRIAARGGGTIVTVDPSTRTYWEDSGAQRTFEGDPAEVTVRRSRDHRTILGYQAERIDTTCRQVVRLVDSTGAHQPVTREIRADVVNWCTSAVPVPRAMTRMMNVVARFVPLSNSSMESACPLPLESTVTLSTLQGFRVVSRVEAVRRLASVPATALQVPPGYARVDSAAPQPSK